jgi:hypothetical protein
VRGGKRGQNKVRQNERVNENEIENMKQVTYLNNGSSQDAQLIESRTAIPKSGARRSLAWAELEELKSTLLRPVLERTRHPELCKWLRLAANEALAAAWGRPSPFLLFPCLLEEKLRETRCWFQRQQKVLASTGALIEQLKASGRTGWAYAG